MKNTNDKIHSQLSSYVSGQGRSYLQDAVVTMRNGRYCIPVKSEYKGQVPGMVHDQSSTGSTVFVEPMAIVKLNNELRELEVKEQAEIEIILSNLSQETAEHLEFIQDNLKILTQLDFIFAELFWQNLRMPQSLYLTSRALLISRKDVILSLTNIR